MSRQLLFWGIFLFIILAEVYGYVAVRTALNLSGAAARWGLAISYWALTLGLWAAALWAINTRQQPSTLKSYLTALPLILLTAKLVVLLPLLLEDLTRLVRWVSGSRPATGPAGSGIARSEFVSRLALGLGLVPLAAMLWGDRKSVV